MTTIIFFLNIILKIQRLDGCTIREIDRLVLRGGTDNYDSIVSLADDSGGKLDIFLFLSQSKFEFFFALDI